MTTCVYNFLDKTGFVLCIVLVHDVAVRKIVIPPGFHR